jgi:hypothetical protein
MNVLRLFHGIVRAARVVAIVVSGLVSDAMSIAMGMFGTFLFTSIFMG